MRKSGGIGRVLSITRLFKSIAKLARFRLLVMRLQINFVVCASAASRWDEDIFLGQVL